MKFRSAVFCSALFALVVTLGATTPASAQTLTFTATLKGASEVPPKAVPGSGAVVTTLDVATNHLHYKVSYAHLTGDATAAHFHGPAAPGTNAGVAVGLKGSLASPVEGDATLTPEQVADLVDGKWYFNVHTAANPGGELRGQLEHGQ